MLKIIKYTASIIISTLLFASCEKVLDIDLPEGENKLVLNGFLMPDSTIKVYVGRSRNILENTVAESFQISDANVKLYKNDEFVSEMTFIGEGYYEFAEKPEPDAIYKISAQHKDFINTATAECSMLKPTEITKFEITEETVDEAGWQYTNRKLKITFTDNPDERNFYMVALQNLTEYEMYDENGNIYYESYLENISYFYSEDPVFESDIWKQTFEGETLHGAAFSDRYIPGSSYSLEIDGGFLYNPRNLVTAYIYSIDEDFYRYILSYQNNSYTSDNPFAEPVSVYSNITDGIGLLTATACDTAQVYFEIENQPYNYKKNK